MSSLDWPPLRAALVGEEPYGAPQLDVAVQLNTNENPYGPSPEAAADIAEAVREVALGLNRYPDRAASRLRSAIGELHGVGPEQVFAANGSNEVLQTLLLTYGGPGRTAAVFEPTYALHSHLSRVTGTTVVEGERNAEYGIDTAEIDRVVTESQPDVVFLCSPNNPTGRVEPREVVEYAIAAAPGLVVVDEAYGQFADWSALELLRDDLPLVVTRTFSKTWSMAGARLGYLVGPAWLVEELTNVVLPYHLDVFKQLAGTLAVGFVDEMHARVATLREERGRLVARLSSLDVDVTPSDANFVLFRPRGRAADDVWQDLVDRSVLVRNCSSWPRLEGCLRVTVGTTEEDNQFLSALEEALSS